MARITTIIDRPAGCAPGRFLHARRPRRPRGGGFTLIESLMASVILAVVVSAVLAPFTVAMQSKVDAINRLRAQHAATELMERIVAMDFLDPDAPTCRHLGPDASESSAAAYDNVDDWHGYVDVIADEGYEDLTREVSVKYLYPAGQPTDDPCTCCAVTVSVRANQGELQRVSRLFYADLEEGG